MSEVHGNLRPCHLFASIMVVEVQEEKASQLYLTHIHMELHISELVSIFPSKKKLWSLL